MGNKAKMLIVDDHPGILEVTAEALKEHLGQIVKTANSAMEALQICSQERFDLICTDFMMPGMNGVDFIAKLRSESGANVHTKVFILTGNPEDAAKSLGDLTDINIIKKVDGINSLIDIISNYFGQN